MLCKDFLYLSYISLYVCSRHIQQLGLLIGDSTVWWKAGLGIAAVTALGFLVVRVLITDRR
jgi:hypothetical protein